METTTKFRSTAQIPATTRVVICRADYSLEDHRGAIQKLMISYALDPMGGEQSLSDQAIARLPDLLANHSNAGTVLAFAEAEPVGIVNFFLGLSTFRAEPLLNIHDFFVRAESRRIGIGRKLMLRVEQEAKRLRCCKVTLEVRQDNIAAIGLYEALGFTSFALVDRPAPEIVLQKLLVD